jgi:hypothetical protein
MSIFRPNLGRSHRLKPGIEGLVGRVCPVKCIPLGNGVFCFPEGPPTPPRTGGAAFRSGSTLVVVTNHPGANHGTIQDDGAGSVAVAWNGHRPPTFHGVTGIVLDGKGRKNTFDFTLTGNVTEPHAVDVVLHSKQSTFDKNLGNFSNSGEVAFDVIHEPPPASLARGL